MGAGQSGLDIDGSTFGYHVLRVQPNSPGAKAGLQAYFDFIVAVGKTRFNREDGALKEILKASIDQSLRMIVYNTRTKSTRDIDIVPSTNWGGQGLLGVSIKYESFENADERVWHVVGVQQGSPAQQAGLQSNVDYIIGADSILQESEDLYNLIEAHEGKALKLFVYNVDTDNCREVICHPNSRWGGEGSLGCEFGHGYLHRIPYKGSQTMARPPQQRQTAGQQMVPPPVLPTTPPASYNPVAPTAPVTTATSSTNPPADAYSSDNQSGTVSGDRPPVQAVTFPEVFASVGLPPPPPPPPQQNTSFSYMQAQNVTTPPDTPQNNQVSPTISTPYVSPEVPSFPNYASSQLGYMNYPNPIPAATTPATTSSPSAPPVTDVQSNILISETPSSEQSQ